MHGLFRAPRRGLEEEPGDAEVNIEHAGELVAERIVVGRADLAEHGDELVSRVGVEVHEMDSEKIVEAIHELRREEKQGKF